MGKDFQRIQPVATENPAEHVKLLAQDKVFRIGFLDPQSLRVWPGRKSIFAKL